MEIQFSHKTKATLIALSLSLLLSIITTIIICLEVSDAKVKKCVVIPKFASVKWKTSNNIAAYGETGSCRREREGSRGR